MAPDVASADFPVYLQWLHYAEGMIMLPVNTLVVETVLLRPERRSATNVERAMRLLNRTLAAVETQLKGRAYLVGEFSAADTVTGHACIAAAKLGADMSALPNTAAFNERLLARKALQAAWDA